MVQGQPRQIVHGTPSPKSTEQNGLEHLLSKYLLCQGEALSTNPSYKKKKKKRKFSYMLHG
jgi:hypothetical protein